MRHLRTGLVLIAATMSLTMALAAEEPLSFLPFRVVPGATGRQFVRVSLPMPDRLLIEGQSVLVSDGKRDLPAALRVLTWHAVRNSLPRSARRALVSFVYEFGSDKPVAFTLRPAAGLREEPARFPAEITVKGETVTITYRDGPTLTARLQGPPRTATEEARTEIVEDNAAFRWQRIHLPDPQWPRILEIRTDVLGSVLLQAHLQRNLPGDAYAPDFGWSVEAPGSPALLRVNGNDLPVGPDARTHPFKEAGTPELLLERGRYRLAFPTAPSQQRGYVEARRLADGKLAVHYARCTAAEKVPMQQAAWHRAALAIAPAALAPLTPTLEYPHTAQLDAKFWDELYQTGKPPDLTGQPDLAALRDYHHEAIVRSMALGDDWGNVTSFSDNRPSGGVHGMNRLNHCPLIFEEAWRTGSRRLRQTALLWCDNFYDLSIWWGPGKTGGTRYNDIRARGRTPLEDNRTFLWRSNDAVHFCTKGYCSFFLAYEETGDPRMREALEAQVRYAAEHIHCDRGEARNIGDVDDFVRLYRWTGEAKYRDEALRLFRELRTKLSAGDLFSQGGQPIDPNPPFINDDETGYRHPFAKPYIIGYALQGLPRLVPLADGEPKLREVIRAVADFLADSQDPLGGWRYPHPRSSTLLLQQAVEHAGQLAEADRYLGPTPKHLDAIERVLRQRILGWKKMGRILSGLSGWEFATGKATQGSDLSKLYARPQDRDMQRDYVEGQLNWGSSMPEGLICFPAVLGFYLEHRPAARLLAPPRDDEPLGKVLARAKGRAPQDPGVRDNLPVFRDRLAERTTHPLSWLAGKHERPVLVWSSSPVLVRAILSEFVFSAGGAGACPGSARGPSTFSPCPRTAALPGIAACPFARRGSTHNGPGNGSSTVHGSADPAAGWANRG